MYVGDRRHHNLHSRHFWPHAHVTGSRSTCFIPQSDWLLKILRGNGRQKIHGNATRPLSRFFGRGLGTRLTPITTQLAHACPTMHCIHLATEVTMLSSGAIYEACSMQVYLVLVPMGEQWLVAPFQSSSVCLDTVCYLVTPSLPLSRWSVRHSTRPT